MVEEVVSPEIVSGLIPETANVVESLRPLISQGLENPISPEALISGTMEPAQAGIGFFDGFTREQAVGLFDVLKEESDTAIANETGFLHPDDLIAHEMQHITVAEDLGVNLEDCKLQLLFLKPQSPDTPAKVVDLQVNFKMPESTSPWVILETSLAPDHMSGGDINTFIETVKKNKLAIAADPVRAANLLSRYRDKNGAYPKIW